AAGTPRPFGSHLHHLRGPHFGRALPRRGHARGPHDSHDLRKGTRSMSTHTPTAAPPRRKISFNVRQYGILVALAVIILLFQVLTAGRLLMPGNVNNLIQQNAYVLILAIGMVMVIIAGHIDLS